MKKPKYYIKNTLHKRMVEGLKQFIQEKNY